MNQLGLFFEVNNIDKQTVRIEVQDWLSEAMPKVFSLAMQGGKTLLEASTGLGKSRGTLHYIQELRDKGEQIRVLFAAPTQILVDDLARNYSHLESWSFGYGEEGEYIARLTDDNIVTTYEIATRLDPSDFDLVFIDEAHLLVGWSTFRKACELIYQWHDNTVLISATPDAIERFPVQRHITVEAGKKAPKRVCKIHSLDTKLRRLQVQRHYAYKIINDYLSSKRDTLLILNINNKDLLNELYDDYSQKTEVALLYSEGEGGNTERINSQYVEGVKRGEVHSNISILLCTSVVYAGVSMSVKRPVEVYMVEGEGMPHPTSVIQFANRVRNAELFDSINVIGSYGSAMKTQIEYDINWKNKQLFKYARLDFQTAAENIQDDYIGYLQWGNLFTETTSTQFEIEELDMLHQDSGDISIIQSLGQTAEYLEIESHKNAFKDDLSVFHRLKKGIRSGNQSKQVESIIRTLKIAQDLDLRFSTFITSRYRSGVVNQCKAIASSREKEDLAIIELLLESRKGAIKFDMDVLETASTEAMVKIFKWLIRKLFKRPNSRTKTSTKTLTPNDNFESFRGFLDYLSGYDEHSVEVEQPERLYDQMKQTNNNNNSNTQLTINYEKSINEKGACQGAGALQAETERAQPNSRSYESGVSLHNRQGNGEVYSIRQRSH